VLYCSVDEAFARQVVDRFENQSDIDVTLVTDTEAGKTTGLVQKLRLERDRPRADVFWSSEQSQTVLLARDGIFAPYQSPVAADIPEQFKDTDHLWTGIALRARVLAYDPRRVKPEELPKTWEQLADVQYASGLTIANPLFGTTRGHVAAMYAAWGPDRFRQFVTSLSDNRAAVVDGNSTAVRQLIAGRVRFAMTDSDDVSVVRAKGHAIEQVFCDMGDGGTMVIPNTVALVAGAAHPEAARELIDYLISAEVEKLLAKSDSANYPVRASLRKKLNITLPPASKITATQIADAMPDAVAICRDILLQ